MNRIATFALLLVLAVPAVAAGKSVDDPVVFGVTSGNASCVIFAEGHKTSGRFYGVAITTKTVGKLEVVETQNYTIEPKEFVETKENLDELSRRALKDLVKYVKIPERYSPETLAKARAMCK